MAHPSAHLAPRPCPFPEYHLFQGTGIFSTVSGINNYYFLILRSLPENETHFQEQNHKADVFECFLNFQISGYQQLTH